MVYYELVKVTINTLGLAEVIIDIIMYHHGISKSIVTDQGFLFTSKFWFLLYYFLSIKKRLFTTFYYQMNGQIKKQNSTMEVYLTAFINL